MNVDLITNLREWAPLTDLLNKVPVKVQKGFLQQELNVVCVDVLHNFIALGTDVGIVFWYNRISKDVQKLRCEFTSPVTCLKTISSVEYMVAAGSSNGQVSVFQIPKQHSPDLNLVTPLTKSKPIERYTIRDLHHSSVKCVEWSKNGMKLFSGDRNGLVVLTEFDFQAHISKSMAILNEAYEIVQMNFCKPWLLISTIYRAIICERESDGKWKVSQIGKKDRKILSDFGATFMGAPRKPTVISGRPGFRFWVADTQGNVSHTYLLKDAITKSAFEVPLLNPGRINGQLPINFGQCYPFMNNYLITYNHNVIYFLNLDKLKIEATIKRLRKIQSLSICDTEIFILEGPRSLIRISTAPEPPNKTCSKIMFNPLMPGSAGIMTQHPAFIPPVEFEADEEDIINAEECFELPPIEQIHLTTPLHTSMLGEHNLLRQDQLLLEHSKKAEIFEKINQLDYDESILFGSTGGGGIGGGIKRKKIKNKSPKSDNTGIVEIGQQAEPEMVKSVNDDGKEKLINERQEKTTRPCLLEASFCGGEDNGILPDLRSPDTINRVLETKEKLLAEALNIEPIKCGKIDTPLNPNKLTPDIAPEYHIPNHLYKNDTNVTHTTPLKKIHFIANSPPTASTPTINNTTTASNDAKPSLPIDAHNLNNLSDDFKTQIFNLDKLLVDEHMAYPSTSYGIRSQHQQQQETNEINKFTKNDGIPEIKIMPQNMTNIPSLWNVTIIEKSSEPSSAASSSSTSELKRTNNENDWEFVDM